MSIWINSTSVYSEFKTKYIWIGVLFKKRIYKQLYVIVGCDEFALDADLRESHFSYYKIFELKICSQVDHIEIQRPEMDTSASCDLAEISRF